MIMIGDFRKFNQCLWKISSIASINFCNVRSPRVWRRVWLSSKHFEIRIWGSGGQALPVALFLQTRNFTPLCLSSPRCINGYRQHTAGG